MLNREKQKKILLQKWEKCQYSKTHVHNINYSKQLLHFGECKNNKSERVAPMISKKAPKSEF
jgi:hypothetical protein